MGGTLRWHTGSRRPVASLQIRLAGTPGRYPLSPGLALLPAAPSPLAWPWTCHPAVTSGPGGQMDMQRGSSIRWTCAAEKEMLLPGSSFVPILAAHKNWEIKKCCSNKITFMDDGWCVAGWDTLRAQTERRLKSAPSASFLSIAPLFLSVGLCWLTHWGLLLAGCLCSVLPAPSQEPVLRVGVPTRASLCSLPGPTHPHPLHSSTRSQRGGRGTGWGEHQS